MSKKKANPRTPTAPKKAQKTPLLQLIDEHEQLNGKLDKDRREVFDGVARVLSAFPFPAFTTSLAALREATKIICPLVQFDATIQRLYGEEFICFATPKGDLMFVTAADAMLPKRSTQVWLTEKGLAFWAAFMRIRHRDLVRGLATISPMLTEQLVGLNSPISVDYLKTKRISHACYEQSQQELQGEDGRAAKAPLSAAQQPEIGLAGLSYEDRDGPEARQVNREISPPRVEEGGHDRALVRPEQNPAALPSVPCAG